ncbi:MAG: RidA family protein [Desulfobacteraceae bacterium]|nr:RidA family protein [Desulfobacteraceae bacterium]
MRKVIYTEKAPQAAGPYSQAIGTESFVFTAGQVGMDPVSGQLVDGGIQAQTRQVMKNLSAVLEEAGTKFSRVVKATVFLADINNFSAMNEVYATYFPTDPPARSAFQVAALPLNAMVEIEMVALKG